MASSVFVWPGFFFSSNGTTTTSSLPIAFPDGVVGAPSIAFASSLTTGFWQAVAGAQVALSIAGAKIYAWDSSNYYFLSNAANIAMGAGLDTSVSRVSAGVVGIGTGAGGSVAGTISAAAYRVGGSAGANGTGTVVTQLTVVNGLVTSCTIA